MVLETTLEARLFDARIALIAVAALFVGGADFVLLAIIRIERARPKFTAHSQQQRRGRAHLPRLCGRALHETTRPCRRRSWSCTAASPANAGSHTAAALPGRARRHADKPPQHTWISRRGFVPRERAASKSSVGAEGAGLPRCASSARNTTNASSRRAGSGARCRRCRRRFCGACLARMSSWATAAPDTSLAELCVGDILGGSPPRSAASAAPSSSRSRRHVGRATKSTRPGQDAGRRRCATAVRDDGLAVFEGGRGGRVRRGDSWARSRGRIRSTASRGEAPAVRLSGADTPAYKIPGEAPR